VDASNLPISEWYGIDNIQELDSPALVVYPERVQDNIRLLLSMSQGPAWLRPHVKTHKMAQVVELMLAAGIYQFKCATIAEAEMLAQAGATDVLLAYQPVGPKVGRLLRLQQAYPQVQYACLVDDLEAARQLATAFAAAGLTLPVYLDLNVGMNRTGIAPGPAARDLYRACGALAGLRPVGLHAYDGQFRDADFQVRQQQSDAAFTAVTDLAAAITALGFPAPVLVAGGTPTFPVHARRPGVVCSPGTFIFWDWTYHTALPEQPFQFAALVVTRVISKLDAETLCLDLGHKSIAAENPFPRVIFLNAPDARPIAQSEEHLVVKVDPQRQYQVGEVFYGVPVHICPTCALYEKAFVVRDGRVAETWPIAARNRYITI
jgi:D-serine deaminase-like pyridoxal phosphate-dependent protein